MTMAEPLKPKPTHYKVVSISMYNDDIRKLDEKVDELRRRGHHHVNRSALIRFALDSLDLDKVPKRL